MQSPSTYPLAPELRRELCRCAMFCALALATWCSRELAPSIKAFVSTTLQGYQCLVLTLLMEVAKVRQETFGWHSRACSDGDVRKSNFSNVGHIQARASFSCVGQHGARREDFFRSASRARHQWRILASAGTLKQARPRLSATLQPLLPFPEV